jgi:hypothetical protein
MDSVAAELERGFVEAPAFALRLIQGGPRDQLSDEDRALVDLFHAALVRAWVDVLGHVSPAEATTAVQRLWDQTSFAWRTLAPKLHTVAQRAQIQHADDPFEHSIRTIESEEFLIGLPPTARVYWRAFAGFVRSIAGSAGPQLRDVVSARVWGEWPRDPKLECFFAHQHAFMVAGLEDGVPDTVTNALASAFWRALRGLADCDSAALAAVDGTLHDALREAGVTRPPEPVADARPSAEPSRRPVLARIRDRAEASPSSWTSVASDASKNLDKYLYDK